MDEFTRELARIAYDNLRSRRRDKGKPISAAELAAQIDRQWLVYRDGTIALWAARIRAHAPQQRLVNLAERTWEMLQEWREVWELPDDEATPEEWATFTAQACASLRWVHRELRGQVPVPRYTAAELADWLAEVQTVQLPLGL